ncbi:uncharacterized protein Z518_05271 [Rhinocladiella mackenziei CBS 650.93]|uniref:Rhinocladiella mackenziei CBS 650.93 unplaced genomic scaffold supercont1.4, whole genome shotgun sequence n=1 Tax=Rhinocladiella mackenziei CBS 650.93 TaxID=1442369 RepID=A0A0D2H1T9_9EURO|nr:uncharacterized protein Z518_05271 [Rhinocladiella mackenziei CBS 650.93]KIX04403.1 hypothetical protein Z518_05271 [Rhinocladiella mackenziei CBS 650.93]
MPHSRPPQFPPFCSSFKKHRSSIDSSRFTVDLTLPKPIAAPVWASIPTPPMSGSPPPEPPTEPPQIAGRRRKRSHTPPTSTTAVATSPITPLEHTAPRLGAQGRGGETLAELVVQPGLYGPNYPPPASYPSASSQPGTSVSRPEPRYALSPISPRATRKPKPHVASACINCKKKHLRCDNERPCRRCVQSGKEDTCVDVEHKKRGRPPLKPEDPSARRPFESALSPMSASLGDPLRRIPGSDPSSYIQSSGYQRNFRPLQAYDPTRSQVRGPPFQSMYAQPSISPSSETAAGTFVPSSRQYQTGPTPLSAQSPSSYSPAQSEASIRSITSYTGGYTYPPQGQMGPPSQLPYSNPIFPRRPTPSSLPTESLPPLQSPSALQLPPIRRSPPGPIDPAIAQQPPQHTQESPRTDQESRDDGTKEPDPKRPKMDIQGILGPRE